jgi:hypothetical protein
MVTVPLRSSELTPLPTETDPVIAAVADATWQMQTNRHTANTVIILLLMLILS